MLEPVECKPACPVKTVGHVPQHEVAVDLVEAIAGVEESRPKTSPRLVGGEPGILTPTRINPGGKHALGADMIQQGSGSGWVTIILPFSGPILGPSCQLRPNCPNDMQVALDTRLEAHTELCFPTGIGRCRLGLHVRIVRPEAHPDLTHSKQQNARAFVHGNGVNPVHSTLGGVWGQAVAQPINLTYHCLAELLRVRTVLQQPVLERLSLNTTRPGTAR